MEKVQDLIEGVSLSLLFLVALLALVGHWTAGGREGVLRGGRWAATIAFLAYAGFEISEDREYTGEALARAAFRGVIAAGLVIGPAWIVFSLLAIGSDDTIRPAAGYARRAADRMRRRQREEERAREARAEGRKREEERRRPASRPAPPPPEPTREEKAAFAHREFQRALDEINKRSDLTDGQKAALGHEVMETYLDALKQLAG